MTIDDENNEKLSIEFVDDCAFISNSSFHFSGAYFKSESGKYILAWRESLQALASDDEVSESDDEINYDDEQLTEAEEALYARYLEQEFKEGFLLIEDQKNNSKGLFAKTCLRQGSKQRLIYYQ